MSDKIKKFFQNKKDRLKFQHAGPGRKLNATDQGPSTSKSKKEVYIPPKRNELSSEARTAAEAAMSRIRIQDGRDFNNSLATIRAQVRKELEDEKKAKLNINEKNTIEDENSKTNLAVQGVYFRCPLINNDILSRKEWKIKIKEFLYEQLEFEKSLTACLIILNCNIKEKAEMCVETLTKYLENIINNPEEEKYRKIRMSNRIFCDKVKCVEGGLEFLHGAGFIEQTIDEDTFLIYSDEIVSEENKLSVLIDALQGSEIITLELDRNIQVLSPTQASRIELPPEFYRISPEEIKREQKLKSEALENVQILKTKAMREREELRVINRYKFALLRIRFPDGVFLQGTFNVYEKLSDVYEFVQSCLKHENVEFSLFEPTGYKFTEDDRDKTIFDLRLIPNTLLTFVQEAECFGNYLKDDILLLIQA